MGGPNSVKARQQANWCNPTWKFSVEEVAIIAACVTAVLGRKWVAGGGQEVNRMPYRGWQKVAVLAGRMGLVRKPAPLARDLGVWWVHDGQHIAARTADAVR